MFRFRNSSGGGPLMLQEGCTYKIMKSKFFANIHTFFKIMRVFLRYI